MNCLSFRQYAGFIVFFIFLITGCATHRPVTNPALDKKAFALSIQAASQNQDISSSRGSGWAILKTPEKTDKFKIAWATIHPDNIRVTFLLSGLPVETIVMSQETITFLSHTGQHSKYSYHSKDPDMEKFVQVPVKMSEIILVFLGRYPIKSFNDAYFTQQDSMHSNITIREKNQTQYLSFNSQGTLQSLTVTDFLGDMLYKLVVKEYKLFDTRQIPARIEITDNYQRKLTLDITDFKANPSIKESVFQLTHF